MSLWDHRVVGFFGFSVAVLFALTWLLAQTLSGGLPGDAVWESGRIAVQIPLATTLFAAALLLGFAALGNRLFG